MVIMKTVVFAALVAALAVNLEVHRRASRPEVLNSNESAHHWEVYPCSLDPGWQCKNTFDWHNCMYNEQCIKAGDIAI